MKVVCIIDGYASKMTLGLDDKDFMQLIGMGMKVTHYRDGYAEDSMAEILENDKEEWNWMGRYIFNNWEDKKLRTDQLLIQLAEEYPGILQVIEIPDDIEWEIEDDNGVEWVGETHRVWGKRP